MTTQTKCSEPTCVRDAHIADDYHQSETPMPNVVNNEGKSVRMYAATIVKLWK